MSFINLGETIKFLRKKQGITQERLANGIMSRESLSNIENGKQIPAKETVDLLLNRLGVSSRQFGLQLLKADDFDAHVLCEELKTYLDGYDFENAEKLLLKMSKLPNFIEGLMRQAYLQGLAVLCLFRDENICGALAHLNEAIAITLPNFDEKLVHTYLLGVTDIGVIGLMSDAYHLEGKHKEAISLLEKLTENIKKRYIDPHEKARSLAYVLYKLTSRLGNENKHLEALELCDYAIKECETHRYYGLLPVLKYNKASCLFHMGKHEGVENLIHQAYFGSLSHGDNFFALKIKESASEIFGILLP